MVDDDPEIERSPLSREFSLDGVTVNVEIYRLKGGDEGWSLEVVDHEWASTVWDDLFATDQEAYQGLSEHRRAGGHPDIPHASPATSLTRPHRRAGGRPG